MKADFRNVEQYILSFPGEIQILLRQVYDAIKTAAPEAEEGISYGMPAFKLNGKPLVYFAGFKNHIGFYATPAGHQEFARELSKYKQGKGSVQFPIDEPMPLELIRNMTRFKVDESNTGREK